jgi:hypothetical protein
MLIGVVEESTDGEYGEVWDLERTSVMLVVRLVRIYSVWGLSCCVKSVDSVMKSNRFKFSSDYWVG